MSWSQPAAPLPPPIPPPLALPGVWPPLPAPAAHAAVAASAPASSAECLSLSSVYLGLLRFGILYLFDSALFRFLLGSVSVLGPGAPRRGCVLSFLHDQ